MTVEIENRVQAQVLFDGSGAQLLASEGVDSLVRVSAGVYELALTEAAADSAQAGTSTACLAFVQGGGKLLARAFVASNVLNVETIDDTGAAVDADVFAQVLVFPTDGAELQGGGVAPVVPTAIVTNGNDSGAGSLRAACVPGAVIGFAPNVDVVGITGSPINVQGVRIIGPGSGALEIQRTAGAASLLYTYNAAGDFFELQGVTISGAVGGPSGGVEMNYNDATFRDVVFDSNASISLGGGLVFAGPIGPGASLTMEDCVVTGNSAVNGGALWFAYADLDLQRVTATGNTATNAATRINACTGTIADCTLSPNTATDDVEFIASAAVVVSDTVLGTVTGTYTDGGGNT